MIRPLWATGGRLSPALLRTIDVSGANLDGGIFALACIEMDGRTVAVTAHGNGGMQMWDLITGQPFGDPFSDGGWSNTLLACTTVGGRAIAVTTGFAEPIRIWDLATRKVRPDRIDVGEIGAVEIGCAVLNGDPIVVLSDGMKLAAWNIVTGQSVNVPAFRSPSMLEAMTIASLNGRLAVVAVNATGLLHQWDMATGRPLRTPFPLPTDAVISGIAVALAGDEPVVLIADGSQTGVVRNLVTGNPWGPPLTSHSGSISAVACADVNGEAVAVTAAEDDTIRIWRLGENGQIGAPVAAHGSDVNSVVCATWNERPIVIAGHSDNTLTIRDLGSGRSLRQHLPFEDAPVFGIGCITITDPLVLLNRGTRLDTLNLTTGESTVLAERTGPAACLCSIGGGRTALVLREETGDLKVCELTDSFRAGRSLKEIRGAVNFTSFTTNGRFMQLPFGGSGHAGRELWLGREIARLEDQGHIWPVAFAAAHADGRTVFVAVSDTGGVTVWDIADSELQGSKRRLHTGSRLTGYNIDVRTVACTSANAHPLVFTAHTDPFVGVWDLRSLECIDVWPIWDTVQDLAVHEETGRLVVTAGWDLACFDITEAWNGA
jgi:WD40 repeat protein